MNKQIEVYKERVQKLLSLLKEQDPNWISRKKWPISMLEFELGDDFFVRFFIEKDDSLTEIQNHVITGWADDIINARLPQNDEERLEITADILSTTYLLGTEINPEYLSSSQEEILQQQKYLDYAWWTSMKDIIYPTTSKQYKAKLDKKAEELLEESKN